MKLTSSGIVSQIYIVTGKYLCQHSLHIQCHRTSTYIFWKAFVPLFFILFYWLHCWPITCDMWQQWILCKYCHITVSHLISGVTLLIVIISMLPGSGDGGASSCPPSSPSSWASSPSWRSGLAPHSAAERSTKGDVHELLFQISFIWQKPLRFLILAI